ncbi:RidA family protein [Aquirhabdus parva]|uniref:RidA family protein n=1 Tax=Aquirhabdus parva TaxID=2283318 RepID=A0A345P9E6_9GAMM|nr:RidA family protein [Aquirhabdus parva]AXI03905.1 RidA family protein [Aquirhabdus parva]
MTTRAIEQKLAARGLSLPNPPTPLGNYTAVSQAGDLLFISGQLPIQDGKIAYTGRVGEQVTVEDGKLAAELAALNVLAQICKYLGGFERLHHIVRIEGHVSSADGFYSQPAVLDGASDLFAAVLGDKAGHARSAFSHSQLPGNATVELVVIAQIKAEA